MKKQGAFILVMMMIAGVLLDAQDASVTLKNNETETFYFALDPVFSKTNAQSDTFMSLDRNQFTIIGAGGSVRVTSLADGAHAIVGFWVSGGIAQFGSFSLLFTLSAGQTKEFVLKKSGAEIVMEDGKTTRIASSVTSVVPTTAISIDNNYSDWKNYPVIALLPLSYNPATYKVQSQGSSQTQAISKATFWGRGGTRLDTVKGMFGRNTMFVYFASPTTFTKGLSIYMYLRETAETEELNTYTIELPIIDETGTGQVLLWTRGRTDYEVVGTFRTSGFFMEASIDLSKLPEELVADLNSTYSFDLTTAYYESVQKIYEEFYITTIVLSDFYR